MTAPVESLSLLCPTPEDTDLLRACLWTGTPAHDAWARWQRSVGDVEQTIKSDRSGIKSLLPLLHHGLHRSRAIVPARVHALLNGAALAEKLRRETFNAIAARACDALTAAAVPFLVLRGPAVAAAYPEATLRHSHDLDVLIRRSDFQRALAALQRAGFVAAASQHETGTAVLRDASGLPIALHDRLFRIAYYRAPLEQVWARAARGEDDGLPTLDAADHLLHICGHASCSASRERLKWAIDAWCLVARNPTLDWKRFLDVVHAARLALPLATLLRYLASDLEAPVPASVLDTLSTAAATADRAAREVALSGVRAGKRGTFRNIIAATSSPSGQVDVLRWALLPLPVTLREGQALRYPRAWPFYYAVRPLAYVARRAGLGR